MWEGFSTGYLNFELNIAQQFIQSNVFLLIVVGFR
jgi:hypothetical protein